MDFILQCLKEYILFGFDKTDFILQLFQKYKETTLICGEIQEYRSVVIQAHVSKQKKRRKSGIQHLPFDQSIIVNMNRFHKYTCVCTELYSS